MIRKEVAQVIAHADGFWSTHTTSFARSVHNKLKNYMEKICCSEISIACVLGLRVKLYLTHKDFDMNEEETHVLESYEQYYFVLCDTQVHDVGEND